MYTTPNLRYTWPKRRSSTGAAPTHRSRDDDAAPALDAALDDDDDVDDELERARRDGWSVDDDTQDDVDGETRYVYSRARIRVGAERRTMRAMAMMDATPRWRWRRARASSCVVARRGGARANWGGDGVI